MCGVYLPFDEAEVSGLDVVVEGLPGFESEQFDGGGFRDPRVGLLDDVSAQVGYVFGGAGVFAGWAGVESLGVSPAELRGSAGGA